MHKILLTTAALLCFANTATFAENSSHKALSDFQATGPALQSTVPQSPQEYVELVIQQALKALSDKTLTDEAREAQFRTMLDQYFDMPRLSKFVLGTHWNETSEAERQEFMTLFEAFIVHSYSPHFKEFGGEQIKTLSTRESGHNLVLVHSQLIIEDPMDTPIYINWTVRIDPNVSAPNIPYKILDVEVGGVSMLVTQREEFATVIRDNGGTVTGLNAAIRKKLGQ